MTATIPFQGSYVCHNPELIGLYGVGPTPEIAEADYQRKYREWLQYKAAISALVEVKYD
jgi:hypothetical protein